MGEATITITRPWLGVATAFDRVLNFTLLTNGRGSVTIPELGFDGAQGQPVPRQQ
jgi:hypothetical protein